MAMSALRPKADIDQHGGSVRYVPEADSCTAKNIHRQGDICRPLGAPWIGSRTPVLWRAIVPKAFQSA